MARDYGRNERVADQVQRELAVMVQREVGQNLGMITLSAVDVSPDLKNAKVYFTCLQETDDYSVIERELNDMAGHFRHQLAQLLPLKVMPKLKFVFDESIARANRLSSLIDSVNRE